MIVLTTNLLSQSLTNLEKIYELIDISAKEINSKITSNSNLIALKYNSTSELKILEQRVFFAFSRERKNLLTEIEQPNSILNYNIDNAGIDYKEVFKDGFFGDLLVERETLLKGSYFFENEGTILTSEKFEYAVTDTVNRDHINKIENISLPFTSSEVPPDSVCAPCSEWGTSANMSRRSAASRSRKSPSPNRTLVAASARSHSVSPWSRVVM